MAKGKETKVEVKVPKAAVPKKSWVREIRDQHSRKSPFAGTPAAPEIKKK